VARRAPSNHSQNRSGGPSSTSVDNKNHNETPKDSNGKKQDISNSAERFNAITKFAFATSCGHQPGNPYKVNQDTYTLAPNMCG